ncbi:HepT-like ribonuclease domain-containing protein [Pedobacter insulae]|uniref:Uncharacterized conserved protein, contains HEPN domain n=1 Tax=Pedobacter insulae TaxID=414048 RepID=A0A1I2SU50_9SPHI|nr:HepT-like ribonuclease domain-containing protein [Pedobacter insulae]SFG56270.1 Uncharacterized conserved protein, contains HEPN domain [Pedobacter insulae]
MDNQINKLLADVLIALDAIDSYLSEPKKFEDYQYNALLKDAVERNLITVGEAVNHLLKAVPEITISDARKIVNTRNRLTHGYDEIDDVQIWSIIINYLPKLRKEIETLLNQ